MSRFGARSRVSTQTQLWLPANAPFDPMSLTPILWLDASDTSTITSSSGKVSQLNDKSGAGRHFSQATSANQPATGSSTQNGRNVIVFDGSDDYLELGSNGLLRNISGATIYIALAHTTSPTALKLPFAVAAAVEAGRFSFSNGQTSEKYVAGGRRLDANGFLSVTSTASITANAFYAQVAVLDYANSDLYQYIGNSLEGSRTDFQTDGTTSDTDSLRARLAATAVLSAPTAGFADVKFGELLIYHAAHSAANRESVMNYLASKWGFAA